MNFFKSILLDDEDPPKHENTQQSDQISSAESSHEDRNANDLNDRNTNDYGGGWSFGGLIKTLASQSESVIETYRRDLKEFGSGLQKETEVIRDVASRAVKDLPASIEAGTSAAQDVLDGVLKSTAEIISKESHVFASDGELETPETKNSGKYCWFEAQLSAVQTDLNTYCEEPEDAEEYRKWKLRFELESRRGEIEGLIVKNGTLEGIYSKIVPNGVDHETFWCRYFYRVGKLTQQESVRANLVKRVISVDDDDDELSWDVDDDEYEDGNGSELAGNVSKKEGDGSKDKGVTGGISNSVEKHEILNSELGDEKEGRNININVDNDKNNVIESSKKNTEDVSFDEKEMKSKEADMVKSDEKVKPANEMKSEETSAVKSDEKVKSEECLENVNVEEKGENIDVSVVPNKSETEEEDIGWDEIEDIGIGDEIKISTTNREGSPTRAELRKRLSTAEDDEDLSWDIEDDDDGPVKT